MAQRWSEPVQRLTAAATFTGAILFIFTLVGVGVFIKGDSNQFAAYVQATIALAMMAAGYWYGTSKSSSDKDEVTKELLTKGGSANVTRTDSTPTEEAKP